MTIEQKAKCYDDALKMAKKLYEQGTVTESLAYIFPELKESEDERIRKELIAIFKGEIPYTPEEDIKRYIAWLEKQKPIQNINKEDEEVRQYIVRIMKQRDINVPMVQKALTWLEKQSRQKPWSEENEEMIDETLYFIREYQQSNRCKDEAGMQNSVSCEKWLKSLKERYTWKPSDEQMKALHDLNLTGNISYAGQGQVLIGLYNDLKKLTE